MGHEEMVPKHLYEAAQARINELEALLHPNNRPDVAKPQTQAATLKQGDKVRHIAHVHYGIGIVKKISKSGLRAYVVFKSYPAYFVIARLELVEENA